MKRLDNIADYNFDWSARLKSGEEIIAVWFEANHPTYAFSYTKTMATCSIKDPKGAVGITCVIWTNKSIHPMSASAEFHE